MTKFVAKRTAPKVAIWDLFADESDIGMMSAFPGEGPMATVRFDGVDQTVSAPTVHGTLYLARQAFTAMRDAQAQEEDYIEDEDGTIARMRYEEDRAERFNPYNGEPDYY